EELTREYIKNKLLPEKYINDALHIAIGSCNSISYIVSCIVSWDFEHIVKVKTRRIVNLVNTLQGYKEIEIISPKEL
ncbi:MAG: PIN domain nuclease, partial [Candidatus Lokiarchaeota archaeon]|nr:PIN domain nuclease [Candidatus Lokiarchaeota archaeon]